VFRRHPGLLALNSINWARVAVQTGYYVYLGGRMDGAFDLVVPTGNFGNVLSAWVAKQMGVPIDVITIANNQNRGLTGLVNTGHMDGAEVIATLAPAMDVAIPSNLERFTADPRQEFKAGFASDGDILEVIAEVHGESGYLLDPHTATAWKVGSDHTTDNPQVVVATAHPAKFADAVQRAVGFVPGPPAGFDDLKDREERYERIEADPSELERLIR
jgi:threonine synthase